jgi:hypothetical protein
MYGFTMDAASHNIGLEKGSGSVEHKLREAGELFVYLVVFPH